MVQRGLDKTSDKGAKALDWESQDNKTMMDETRHFKTTYGTLGNHFDVTLIERISKVHFKDKLFETSNHDRTVLIGDGKPNLRGLVCLHAQMNPFSLLTCPLFSLYFWRTKLLAAHKVRAREYQCHAVCSFTTALLPSVLKTYFLFPPFLLVAFT